MDTKPHNSTDTVESGRRSFLNRLWIVLGIGAVAEMIWVIGKFLGPRPLKPDQGEFGTEMALGRVTDFKKGSVTAFPRGQFYLVRLDTGEFLALSRRCTHLGCTVPWVAEEKKFICPCHASVYSITGAVLRSPAPRAMDLFPMRIENDTLFVDTGKALQRRDFRKEQTVSAS